jgi:hypothetical protein
MLRSTPVELGVCAFSLFVAVLFRVRLGRFRAVMHRVLHVAGRGLSVVRGRLVIARFVMLAGFTMMSSSVFMMLGRRSVMLRSFFRHDCLLMNAT